MDENTAREANRLLLAAAMLVSPTSKEQKGFIELTHIKGISQQSLTILLINTMSDGLSYGNWPTVKDVNRIES
jgi:hypothetical protein